MSEIPNNGSHPRVRCADLKPGDAVDSVYHLSSLDQRAKKSGDPFYSLVVRDASGSIPGVMWDRLGPLLDGRIKTDDFVRVRGQVAEYNGAPQLTVHRMDHIADEEVNVDDFLPVSPRPRVQLEAELEELLASVKQPDCRRLLMRLFAHRDFREAYCTAPAAAKIHQAYISGLLEHTLNVVRNALQLAEHYPPVDRDLLITGGILHDVGKIREYSWKRSISYTDEGRLIGHISIGAGMIEGAMRELGRQPEGFSEHYRQHILHIILSHHGKLEYGSPVLPKTKEALLLHYGDFTDAYLTTYCDVVNPVSDRGQRWTPYSRMFEAYLYAGGSPQGLQGAAQPQGAPSPAGRLASLPSAVAVTSFPDEPDPRIERNSETGNLDESL
ncbi:HD domain-containing protein [Candidatus Poribacteria bacterium]|nr:HD domain-containing protein [Candidatus Poribacteria bacterium]